MLLQYIDIVDKIYDFKPKQTHQNPEKRNRETNVGIQRSDLGILPYAGSVRSHNHTWNVERQYRHCNRGNANRPNAISDNECINGNRRQ